MDIDKQIMQRCLQLAALGRGHTAPNPMVGAVLLHEGTIIGEGYHEQFGEAHAEVNCVKSVPGDKKALISRSTMYVSLEPCAHAGKTPPCTDLIMARQIPRVVVGCVDPFAAVAGKGIKRLLDAGVEVITGVEEAACKDLNKRFFTFHEKKRPYIILKWAESADGFIALQEPGPVKISNGYTDRLVHRWRGEEAAILAGANTALYDNPRLTNRLWTGKSPVRVVPDRHLKLPGYLKIFDGEAPTLVVNTMKDDKKLNTEWIRIPADADFLQGLLHALYLRNILSVMVEGGAALLRSFIAAGLWDEARVITGGRLLGGGLPAPVLPGSFPVHTEHIEGDRICFFDRGL